MLGVHVATTEESWAIYEREAQRNLGMSAQAFMAAWRRGEFHGQEERPEVMRVAMLLPVDW